MVERVEAVPGLEVLKKRRHLPWYLEVWVRLREKPLGMVGGVMVAGLVFMAIFADVIAPYDYADTGRPDRCTPLSKHAAYGLAYQNIGRRRKRYTLPACLV